MATGKQLLDLERWIDGTLDDDREVRAMVAGLLRKRDTAVCLRLANIIDPGVIADAYGTQMVFKRGQGNRSKQVDHRKVAAMIWQRIEAAGDPREAAYQYAVDHLGVSLRTAKTAFFRYKARFDRHPELARIE